MAILTLSRPEARNAWDEDFNEGLEARLAELEHDHEIRCVILTGDEKGAAFSAGANLADTETHTVDSPAAFITSIPHWRKFVANLLTDFPKPVIAAVNGYAIGIGCIATYCCDLIVASERAEWRLPQVRLGIMPAYGGAVRLSRWVGKGNAMKARPRLSDRRRRGLSHRSGAVAGAARRADGAGAQGRRRHRGPAAAGRAAGQGIADQGPRHRRTSRTPRRSTSIVSWR